MTARIAAFLFLLLTAAGLRAHPILQNPIWIEPAPDRLILHLHVSVRELIVIQGLSVDTQGRTDPQAAADMAERHTGYVLDHFTVQADGRPLTGGKVLHIAPPDEHITGEEGPDNTRFVFRIEYPLPAGLPREFTFSQSMCKEYPTAPGVPWDFSYAARYGSAPGGEVKLFFPMIMEREYRIDTGAAAITEGSTAPTLVERPRQNWWLALWVLYAVLLVCGTEPVRLLAAQAAMAAWIVGFVGASLSTVNVPAGICATLCGAAVLLVAMDNAHGPTTGRRRFLFSTAGAFVFGWALYAQQPPWISAPRTWPLAALGAGAVAALGISNAAAACRRQGTQGRMALSLFSITGSAFTVWALLVLLDLAA
jgi:hypothetical protein